MSSILKALKKLEKELPSQNDNQNNSHLPQIDTKTTIRRQAERFQLLNRIFSVLLAAMIFTGSGWFILKQKPDWVKKLFPDAIAPEPAAEAVKMPLSAKSKTQNVPLVAVKTESVSETSEKMRSQAGAWERETAGVPSHSQAETSTSRSQAPAWERKEIIPEKNRQLPIASPSEKAEKKTVSEPVKPKPDRMLSSRSQVPAGEQKEQVISKPVLSESESVKSDDVEKSDSVEDDTEEALTAENDVPKPKIGNERDANLGNKKKIPSDAADAEEINDARFQIQALVWSPEPESCFAMINNQIVKIGGFINDTAVVNYIGSDYVIIQEGEKKWKLKFQLK